MADVAAGRQECPPHQLPKWPQMGVADFADFLVSENGDEG
jgi:hypothetical protein